MYQEGQTATNPKTGQRIVYRGGYWVSADGASGVPAKMVPDVDQQALDRARQEAEAARFQSRAAQQFLQYNRETGTGGLRNTQIGLPWGGGNIIDVPAIMRQNSPNWGAMEGLTAAAAPRNRVPGSGATSDFETRMMIAGFPSVDKRGDANSLIASRLANEDARARARAAFFDTWTKRTGSLNGADAAFSAWWTPYAAEHGLDIVRGPKRPSRPARAASAPASPAAQNDPLGIRGN